MIIKLYFNKYYTIDRALNIQTSTIIFNKNNGCSYYKDFI